MSKFARTLLKLKTQSSKIFMWLRQSRPGACLGPWAGCMGCFCGEAMAFVEVLAILDTQSLTGVQYMITILVRVVHFLKNRSHARELAILGTQSSRGVPSMITISVRVVHFLKNRAHARELAILDTQSSRGVQSMITILVRVVHF